MSNHSIESLTDNFDKYEINFLPNFRLIGIAARDLGFNIDSPCFEFKILVGKRDEFEESKEPVEESKSEEEEIG